MTLEGSAYSLSLNRTENSVGKFGNIIGRAIVAPLVFVGVLVGVGPPLPIAYSQVGSSWVTLLAGATSGASCGFAGTLTTPPSVNFPCPAAGQSSVAWPSASATPLSPDPSLGVFVDNGTGGYKAWNAAANSPAYRVVRFDQANSTGSMIALGQPGVCVSVNLNVDVTSIGASLSLNGGSAGGLTAVTGPVVPLEKFVVLGLRFSATNAEMLVNGVSVATSPMNAACAPSRYWFYAPASTKTAAIWSSTTAPSFTGSAFDQNILPVTGAWSNLLNQVSGGSTCGYVATVSSPAVVRFACPAGGVVSTGWPASIANSFSPEPGLGAVGDNGSLAGYLGWFASTTSVAYRVVRVDPATQTGLSIIALGLPGNCVSVNLALDVAPSGATPYLNGGSSGGLTPVAGSTISVGRTYLFALKYTATSAQMFINGVLVGSSPINTCPTTRFWFHPTGSFVRTVALWSSSSVPGFSGADFDASGLGGAPLKMTAFLANAFGAVTKPAVQAPHASDPVSMTTGAMTHESTDLAVPGRGVGFRFLRSYDSKVTASGPLGVGWGHAFDEKLTVDAATNAVTWSNGTGAEIVYWPDGAGAFVTPVGVLGKLAVVAGLRELTTQDQLTHRFGADGKLTKIVDRSGQGLTMAYDASGRLSTVTDASARVATYTYGTVGAALGRLVSVATGGRTVRLRTSRRTRRCC
jgi:YD repeat-containing protein